MRFLKPLTAQIAPNERSRKVAQYEEQTDGTSYEMRRHIAGLKSRLAKRGDATKVTVSGLSINEAPQVFCRSYAGCGSRLSAA